MNSRLLKGYVMVILSAVIYGCMPLMAKYIYADGSNAMTLVFLRNLLALPALATMSIKKDKTLKISPKRIPELSLLALFGCCLTPLLLFTSYVYIPSGTSTVLHFVYPALVVVGGILLGERLKATSVISVLLCIVGISMFYDTGAPINLKPKGTEHLTPRKALFGLNIPLSLEIRKVILRFAGIFILKNHLSSVREKFQMGIFVPGKEHFPQSYLAYYKGM